MKGRGFRRLRAALVKITLATLFFTGQIAAGSKLAAASLSITAPANGANVSATVTIATAEDSSVSWINVYVDNAWVASNPPAASPPYSVSWDSTTAANGPHIVSVDGYDSNNTLIETTSIGVSVQNGTPSPRPTPTRSPRPTPTSSPRPTATPSRPPTPTPKPTATAAVNWVTITAPANGASVAGNITVATAESATVNWINVYVDNGWVASNPSSASPPYSVTWDSTTVANGPHTLSVNGYNSLNAVIATSSSGISVLNGLPAPTVSPRPTSTPASQPSATPSALPTHKPSPPPATPTASPAPTRAPTPTASATCCPMADAAAAAMVILNPNFEPRPDNYPANTTVPTSAELAQVGTLNFLDGHGNSLIGKVTGNYTGTTDEILQWASYKWGFDPDVTRATAVTESYWHQYDIGDIGNGVSLGILQVKSSDYPGTCDPVALNGGDLSFVTDPLCLSYSMTGFAVDYKLAYQRACMDGSIGYLYQQSPTAGYPTYASATGQARLWGCVGNWYSGNWYDSGALSYIQEVQGYLGSKPWLQPGF